MTGTPSALQPTPHTAPEPGARVIFVHIPKASGTTLRSILIRQYGRDRVHYVQDVEAFMTGLARQSEAEKATIRFVHGHIPFGLHQYLPGPSVYLTMLRSPVERIVSHYYYVRREPAHPLHARVVTQRMTLEDYVGTGLSVELNDDQVRLLSGLDARSVPYGGVTTAMLESAKTNLERSFAGVGLTERFDESVLLFRSILGWGRVYYVPLNVTAGRVPASEISESARRIIERYNALDLQLYEHARSLLESALRKQGIDRCTVLHFRAANAVHRRLGSVRRWLTVSARQWRLP